MWVEFLGGRYGPAFEEMVLVFLLTCDSIGLERCGVLIGFLDDGRVVRFPWCFYDTRVEGGER